MKKSLAVIVGTALLFSTFIMSAVNVGVIGEDHSQQTPSGTQLIFEDDFEDGTLNKWILSSWNPCGVLEVTDVVSHSNPYCLHAQSDPGTNTGPYVRKDFNTGYQKINAEVWVYLPPKAQAYDQFNLLRLASHYGSPPLQYCLGIVLNDDDYSIDIREDYYDVNGVHQHVIRHLDIYPLAPQTWHKINLEINDITYKASVGGTVIVEDSMVFINAMDSIMLGDTKGSSGGWGDVYWDDVKVWEFTTPQQTVDLSIYGQDISLSDPNPTEGNPVTIEATVHGDQGTPGGWQKFGIVLDIGGPGQGLHIGKPSVLQMPNGTYAMWYHGTDVSYGYSIFRAWSPDGITWHKQGVIMQKGGAYQETGVYVPYVIYHNGVYHMWYGGLFQSGGNRASIHYATSTDEGFTWQKQGMELYHNSGVTCPYVLFDGSQWRMWYCGIYWGNPNQSRIHHAHKTLISDPWIQDGVVVNNDGPYDYPSASYPNVLPTATGYEMFYTGYVPYTGPFRILHATSPDGMSWTKTGIELEGSLPEETNRIGMSYISVEGSTYKAWYTGYDGSHNQIFYAEKNPAEPGLDATCTVSFYLDAIAPQNLIHQELNVFVPGDGTATVTASWMAGIPGNHDIIVEISDVDPPDSDLSNNVAAASVIVTPTGNDATATATGPQGAHHDPIITITYDWTGTPDAVDLFYSENNGDEWHYLGTDYSVDGSFDWEPEANPGPKPSKYWWIANAKNGADDVGIPADGTEPEAGPFNWKTWDVCEDAPKIFRPGADNWYFISFPLDVSGDVLTVFDDAEWGDGGTTWDVIQWYDAFEHRWRSYSMYRPPELNDMPQADNTMGFWIHLTGNDGDGMLTIGEGIGPVSTTINLYTGWNLVGYPSNTEIDAETALWGTGADHVMVFDPQSPYRITEVPLTHMMKPGEGYWVHVPFDTVWIVDW
jgi:hypothetical protein